AELVGVTLLIALLAARARRGPAILFETQGHDEGHALGYLGPFLAAARMASYVLYGFDTAGTLAEETDQPRRRAPRAILSALGARAGPRAGADPNSALARGRDRRPRGSPPDCQHRPASRDRNAVLGRHRLGEPGLPPGHLPDADRTAPAPTARAPTTRGRGR